MEHFVVKPNLPQGVVKTVIIGNGYHELEAALSKLGIKAIPIANNDGVAQPVRAHADMSAYYCGNGELIISKNIFESCDTEMFPTGTMLYCSNAGQSDKYPMDIGLNACEVGDVIFCSVENTDAAILEHAEKHGKKLINVRQGYAKCSVCVLDETHIITADKSIAEAAQNAGIEVLLIEPGYFELPGYDYGFIGGSCFKCSANMIAFTGSLEGHPDKEYILEFINKLGLKVVYLTNGRCFDVGSILPLSEER
ncbi:MAG: hypothetical protein IKL27_06855 [Oscillospiraceae bacterium]|nr:hypothetical protein [Oscillospiraceae bacterium]